MTQPPNTTASDIEPADPEPPEAEVARRARERRYQRAVAGWLASGLRAKAHERRRAGGEPSG
jgi:hypothetical protein